MLSAGAGDPADRAGTGATAVTGSSYIPIVVPIMAFVAMGFWLGLILYADSHPGYRHRKVLPVSDDATEARDSEALGPEHELIGEHDAGALLR